MHRQYDAAKRATATSLLCGGARRSGQPRFHCQPRTTGWERYGIVLSLQQSAGKRLELLKEAFPKIFRVAVLRATGPEQEQQMREIEIAAQMLGIQIQSVHVQSPDDFENGFSTITKGRPRRTPYRKVVSNQNSCDTNHGLYRKETTTDYVR